MTSSLLLVDFSEPNSLSGWRISDDVVMGGRSNGRFFRNDEGHAIFEGRVSLENNGGFSSVRYRFSQQNIEGKTTVKIRLKGDGKNYQFRIKPQARDYYSYIITFKTSGEWEVIEIPINQMYPAFRGRNLNMPNLEASTMEEIAFLIGNKKPENFRLEIASIEVI